MRDPARIKRIMAKLEAAWTASDLSFGQLVERVEDVAWAQIYRRECSARLANLDDTALELALDAWNGGAR